jgi:hypothetical protein
MTLYERGLDILNELRLLPLETRLLKKNSYTIPKKFNLNNKSMNVMKKIKDIKIIVMSNDFNTKVKFPKGVKEIVFGEKFNKEVILPKGLKKLTTGKDFNQKIKLRSSLEILNLGYKFNQLVTLPKNLKYMTLCESYDKPIVINEELKELYYYGKKPLIYPISKEEFVYRGLELYDTTSNGTNRYIINLILSIQQKLEKI